MPTRPRKGRRYAPHNTLVKLDASMKIVGDLALSWTNPDPTTWEFKLRPGVKLQHYPQA
ncbi:MAG: hypothetical protein QOF70_7470, partial [Acetobacteraceae bacterium]|nr:hypothetical protein [Acetobacteraceae bacterium]